MTGNSRALTKQVKKIEVISNDESVQITDAVTKLLQFNEINFGKIVQEANTNIRSDKQTTTTKKNVLLELINLYRKKFDKKRYSESGKIVGILKTCYRAMDPTLDPTEVLNLITKDKAKNEIPVIGLKAVLKGRLAILKKTAFNQIYADNRSKKRKSWPSTSTTTTLWQRYSKRRS